MSSFAVSTRFGRRRHQSNRRVEFAANGTAVPFCFFVGNRTDKFSTAALNFSIMTATRKPDPELLPIHRPRCPDCQTRMITVAIASGPDGFESRTFECRKCGHGETAILASDPLTSDAAGWIAGELRPPH
jgi:hypothetical protein